MANPPSAAVVAWGTNFARVAPMPAAEPGDRGAKTYTSPAAKGPEDPPPPITEDYIRGYLFHYDFLPATDGSNASAGNCIFSAGTAKISDVIAWLEKRAVLDGYAADPALEMKVASAVYDERQRAQQIGSLAADKFSSGADLQFMLAAISKSSMQDMLDELEAMRAKNQLDAIQNAVSSGPNKNIANPKLLAAMFAVQGDLGAGWKAATKQLSEDDAAVMRHHILARMDEGDLGAGGSPPAPNGKKKDDDDGPDSTFEIDPLQHKADTEVQYTLKLQASNDSDPPEVQFFPDFEITVHLGANSQASIEGQLNIVKINVKKLLHIGGKIKIDAKVGLSGEVDIRDAALGKLAKSLELNIKSEIEITFTKAFSIKVDVQIGPDGKPQIGPAAVVHF